jgi:hypothetical protein
MVDEAINGYVDWREECARVSEAYERWRDAVRADTALAFGAYLAALEREVRASDVYADLISRLETAVLNCPPRPVQDGGS